jgi:hypothetical protein
MLTVGKKSGYGGGHSGYLRYAKSEKVKARRCIVCTCCSILHPTSIYITAFEFTELCQGLGVIYTNVGSKLQETQLR